MAVQREEPLKSIPSDVSSRLHRYRQRDLTPSHLYRLGTKLFKSEPTRHRVIDAGHYVPRELVPHATNLRRTWDGKPLDNVYDRSQRPPLQRRHSDQSLNGVKTSDFTQDQYRQWMDERRSVRNGLDMMAISERWLCTKTRTPLENKVLSDLRSKRKASITASVPIPASQPEGCVTASTSNMTKSDSTARPRLSRRRRQNVLKEAKALELHLSHGKQRFITLLAVHDPAGVGSISAEELECIIQKMKPPISQENLELVLKSLPEVERGRVDYQPLINDNIVQCVKQYTHIHVHFADSTPQALPNHSFTKMSIEMQEYEDSKCSKPQGTMSGDRGTLSTAYKEEEHRQFEILLEFCREQEIVLNQELLEKALLLPADHPRDSCLAALRQPGLDLLSQEFTAPPREETKTVEKRDVGKKFGWAYKELKGKGKPTQIRIPKPLAHSGGGDKKKAMLKRVKVVPKVDCWLTFKEYQKFARDVTSRPGFNYKYHGLPDNNAFWPGALAEKLRLWLSNETLADKPYSLYNIFQPVTHPKIYNPHTPQVEQKRAWPDNEQGYVQFGGDTRKSYAL